ncbi:uncharacterized protein [Coffea arabica]|uniref:Cysteine proteinase inhibitor 5-like n=1 Tax=Coffea arabica TaxID=13443 RepID=A0A6P6WJZ2_COFAR|nr:uncharacterized protein LOC113733780 [Coffea arabica]
MGTGQMEISTLEPVKPADAHVIQIGQFAVEQLYHGRQLFVAVLGGFTGSGDKGKNYYLIIETRDSVGATYRNNPRVLETPDGGLKLISSPEPVTPADPHVIQIGQFVVEQAHHGKLLFVAVVGGFTWSFTGGNYYALIIENQASDGATYLHKALVLETPCETKLIWHKK